MDITVGVVNYNSGIFLKQCLESIYRHTAGLDFETIVIDNNSSDRSTGLLRKNFPQIRIIENKINRGFSKAVNQAFREARGKYVFICNPDTILTTNVLFGMFNFMERNPGVAALGPKILNQHNRLELSFNKRCSDLARCLLDNLMFYSDLRVRIFEKFSNRWFKERLKMPFKVAWLAGAAFLVRKSATADFGLMDENFFLYCEDEDFFCRINKSGWQVYYFPQGEIIHYRGRSTEYFDGNLILESIKSKLYFYQKRYSSAAMKFIKFLFLYRLICECFTFRKLNYRMEAIKKLWKM